MAVIENDIIDLICKELFTIKFLHSGYGFLRKSFLSENIFIEPDNATRILFTNHSLNCRFDNDTLTCYIRTELLSPPGPDPKSPYIKFDNPVLFRFLMNASTDFLRKTNIVTTGAKQVYQFSNRVNAGTGGLLCMHTTGVNNDDLKNADAVKTERPCFGVIDIASSGAVNTGYEIFSGGAAQLLRSPAYSIQFISTI